MAACNMAAMLHLVLHKRHGCKRQAHGPGNGDPREFKSIDELYDALMKQHKFITHRSFWLAAIARNEQFKHVRLPLSVGYGHPAMHGHRTGFVDSGS